MKRTLTLLTGAALALILSTACGAPVENAGVPTAAAPAAAFEPGREITVVSREDGSGTRGAFIELLGIEVKGEDGSKKDMTTKEAVIANRTDVMLQNVAGDTYAIGYVSLGSLNASVKALSIDGIKAETVNVKNGTYKISRPFIIATRSDVTEAAQDFIAFILSAEGQAIVADGYIAVDENAQPYEGAKPAGKVTVAGSSSVTPVMEKLKEAYVSVNPNASVEIQMTDSTAGITALIDGICDIGMASRELKESEAAQVTGISIALDGIAVIVNTGNSVNGLTSEQVRGVFTGETTVWNASLLAVFESSREITVVSREDGSGTRGAFIELLGIEVKGEDGSKKDMTTKEAVIANRTDVMLQNVAGDTYAIGYVSLGSLNASVKALSIDGIKAETVNVKNGTYKISRPFIIATRSDVTEVAQDFIAFILSAEGQAIVADGYIAVDEAAQPYGGAKPAGKITVAGSSSVTPVMEKLKEAYASVNPNASVEIQMTDSTAGITALIDGICDIGMASRELKESEAAQVTGISIALDGIAVIVNTENPLGGLTGEQVRGIFTGEAITWDAVQ